MRRKKRQSFLEGLESRLKGPKPGLAAQLKMVPDPRPGQKTYWEVQETCRPAAVLILLYPLREKPHLVLTLRTSKVDHHRDQVSLPGGEKDGHETIDEAALREAGEELGVRASDVRVLGELTPLYIPPSNFCIFPVVATAAKRPGFRRAPAEVAEIIDLPLDVLNDPDERSPRGLELERPGHRRAVLCLRRAQDLGSHGHGPGGVCRDHCRPLNPGRQNISDKISVTGYPFTYLIYQYLVIQFTNILAGKLGNR